MESRAKAVSRSLDFFIRIVMMFSTIVVLLYLYQEYKQFILLIIGLGFILAIIFKGVADIVQLADSKKNARK